MVYNRRDLKVISIVQIVMTAIFLILGLVDRFQVRYLFTSFLLSPCWTAAIVLPVGIMGLVLISMSRRPPPLIYALKSISVACVAMSAATLYHYQWGIGIMLSQKTRYRFSIVEKGTEFKLTDQEKTMLVISSFAILFCIIEMILAFAFTKSCGDTGYDPPQQNQRVQAYCQIGTGQIQLQTPYIAAQPMVAGQGVVAGQQMVQPMVVGQRMVESQAMVAGQQMVQPMVVGQHMVES